MSTSATELKIVYKSKSRSFPIECLKNGITLENVKWAHGFGEYLTMGTDKEKLSTTQLRKFFGELRRMEALMSPKEFTRDQLFMLIPKLAYAVGRAKKEKKTDQVRIQDFYEELSLGITHVTEFQEFKNFIKIVEAIVAYHKLYE
jgi:CRISPR-associated protein Csm2